MKKNCILISILSLLLFVNAKLMSQTIWNGAPMTFTKEDYADWTLPENQDRITDDIWITRGNTRPIFNMAMESIEGSPEDTKWAFGSISDGVENLIFDVFLHNLLRLIEVLLCKHGSSDLLSHISLDLAVMV